MIKLLVIGAKLQGIEIIYLGKKAGYEVIVADKNENAPGVKLADTFLQIDFLDADKMCDLFRSVDVIMPAIENTEVLLKLEEYSKITGKRFIFDKEAYDISSSKIKSNELFRKLNLAVPEKYPNCGYPVILKPDSESGSANVEKAFTEQEVKDYIKRKGNSSIVIQEYIEGPSYSLEVIGDGEKYIFPQITEVLIDNKYDCKRIEAPAILSDDEREQMYNIAYKLAEKIKIKGIFDIEVIQHKGIIKLLEIDARFPSQTPISVYNSTGINMVKVLVENDYNVISDKNNYCMYQQINVSDGIIEVIGEHIMSDTKKLLLKNDFFGADEAITDYTDNCSSFKAIVIIKSSVSYIDVCNKFEAFIKNIQKNNLYKNWKYIEG